MVFALAVSGTVFKRVNNKLQVLLVQRGKSPGKGLWCVPGGHAELGQTLLQNAKREVEEETGLVEGKDLIFHPDSVIAQDQQTSPEKHWVIVNFCAILRESSPHFSKEKLDIPKAAFEANDAVDIRFEDVDEKWLNEETHQDLTTKLQLVHGVPKAVKRAVDMINAGVIQLKI